MLKLSSFIPESDVDKASFVHNLLSTFSRKFISVLKTRGNIINSARNIKDIFVRFRKTVTLVDPFSEEACSDEYLENSIKNCEGNHMSFPSPPIEVMEQVMSDSKKQPIHQLLEPARECSSQIMNELVVLTNILLDDVGIIRFPQLQRMKEIIIHSILLKSYLCVEKN